MKTLKELKKMKGKILSYEQFDNFLDSLMDLGFGAVEYKEEEIGNLKFRRILDYAKDNGERIIIKYIKEYSNGDIRIQIEDIKYKRQN
jgi:hypothetical protein